MKNILKLTLAIVGLFVFTSCENDTDPIPAANGFELRVTDLVPTIVLEPTIDNDTLAVLNWDKSNNGVSAIAAYKVEVALSGTNFANVAVANLGNDVTITNILRTYSITVKELNKLLNELPQFQCGQPMNVEIRIRSTVGGTGANAFVQYSSNAISLTATPYSTALPLLAFSATANITAVSKLAASSISNSNDYQGYFYLQPGDYKFYRPNTCNEFTTPTVYGLNGANSGSLEVNGTGTFNVAVAGYYFVQANLVANTFSIKFYKAFGIFGLGVRSNPGSSNMVPMTDSNNSNVWKITIELFKGRKIKFKSNDWTAALIGTPPSVPAAAAGTTLISILGKGSVMESLIDVTSTPTTADITVPGSDDGLKQKYDVEINVTNPRKYTYKFTEVPN